MFDNICLIALSAAPSDTWFPSTFSSCLSSKEDVSQQRWRREDSEGKPELYFPMNMNHEPTKCLNLSLISIHPKTFNINQFLLRQPFYLWDSEHLQVTSECLFFYIFIYLTPFKLSSNVKKKIHKFDWQFF